MRRILQRDSQTIELLRWAENPAQNDTFLQFHDTSAALDFLRPFLDDPISLMTLRQTLTEEFGYTDIVGLDDQDMVIELSRRLVRGQIVVAPFGVSRPSVQAGIAGRAVAADVKEKTQAASAAPQTAVSWITFKVVDDATGQPVPSVSLKITLPKGNETIKATNSKGLIEIQNIESGSCDVTSVWGDSTIDQCLDFVRVGVEQEGDSDELAEGDNQSSIPTGQYCIASVEEHKVRTGENLASLGRDVQMTWREVAQFNWGTSEPDQINNHLRDDIGCTKKTTDGQNYIFDSSDEPGIVYLPKKWTQRGLNTEVIHTIKVRLIIKRIPNLRFHYQIDIDAPEAKNDTITLEAQDGSWSHTIKVVDLEEIQPDWVELVYPRPPAGGIYNLIQDPGDGEEPFYIFEGFTYEQLFEEEPEYEYDASD